MSAGVDRKNVAERAQTLLLLAKHYDLTIRHISVLAKKLGTSVETLDSIVCRQGGRESTYLRVLPRLEELESQLAEHVKSGGQPLGWRERVMANYDALRGAK